jgi:hypothetical protein
MYGTLPHKPGLVRTGEVPDRLFVFKLQQQFEPESRQIQPAN